MNINLGDADAGVAISIQVINDYLAELKRIGKLPSEQILTRDFNGISVDIKVLTDSFTFELNKPAGQAPYTRLLITGTIEIRPTGLPNVPPLFTFPLEAKALLSLVLVDDDDPDLTQRVRSVGLRYDGTDGPPSLPVTSDDIDNLFNSPEIKEQLDSTKIPMAKPLVQGLNNSRFPDEEDRPTPAEWTVVLTLLPSGADTIDAFGVTVGPPGSGALPVTVESFVQTNMGLAVAYNRAFLDLMLERGATANEGTTIDGATVRELKMQMSDTAIEITKGHVVRPFHVIIDLFDIDVRFKGPMIPSLVRGTTGMAFDSTGIKVDVDDSDEVLLAAIKWFLTIGSSLLLFTGVGSLTALGILLWLTAVQKIWNGEAELDNAPNVIRDSLGSAMGAQLGLLASALDADTDVGQLRIDATPDSLTVVTGNMVFAAQILVIALQGKMKQAEYSKKLRRFAIYELEDGRRFRAQELARLMRIGKVSIPGFHDVGGRYIRADHDNQAANNLLQQFRKNITKEVVVRNRR